MFRPYCSADMLDMKMQEYMDNGAQLGWRLDPIEKMVHIYRPSDEVPHLIDPPTLSGDPPLPGFVLDLHQLWNLD